MKIVKIITIIFLGFTWFMSIPFLLFVVCIAGIVAGIDER